MFYHTEFTNNERDTFMRITFVITGSRLNGWLDMEYYCVELIINNEYKRGMDDPEKRIKRARKIKGTNTYAVCNPTSIILGDIRKTRVPLIASETFEPLIQDGVEGAELQEAVCRLLNAAPTLSEFVESFV